MALISKSFSLDMTPGVMPPVINVSEYDVNRQLIIFLQHNGGAFTPAAGTTAKIEGTLSNGFGFSENADLSGNSVSFTLTESMTAAAGRAWVKVKLTNDGAPVSSCGFVMNVDRAGVEADTVIGAPGFEEQIVNAVQGWLDEHPPASGGVTEEFKQALLDCFEHVAWIDDQGQDYYDALYDALYPPVDVLSISAVFTQGSAVIYDTDSLDTLKQYLVVTATMSDSTTQTLEDTDYTLSGTLTEGTSVITVSYGGKTTTFNVTVTAAKSDMNGWHPHIAYTDLEIVQNSYVKAANGTFAAYNGWNRTGYVPCNGATTIIFPALPENDGQAQSNWFYDENHNPVSEFQLNKTTQKTVVVPSTAYYFVISSDSAALASCINGGIVPTVDGTEWVSGVPYNSIDVVENSYVAANGGSIGSYTGWDRTGYVPCYGAAKIDFPALPQVEYSQPNSCWFYNLQKSAVQNITLSKTQSTTVTVPSTAAYFIISSERAALATFLNGDITPYASASE